ncbi:MAG: VPLPA-CTERM sorting domain-containing protein [Gemmobacter sp.]
MDLDTWYHFGFGQTGSALVSGAGGFTPMVNPPTIAAPDTPWTFSLTRAAVLRVVDGFLSGDRFEMFNFGVSLGLTSEPERDANCGADLTCALSDARFSQGSFMLAAGDYEITGIVVDSPFGGGAGAFIVETAAIPLPAGIFLLGGALGLLGVVRRRRRAEA